MVSWVVFLFLCRFFSKQHCYQDESTYSAIPRILHYVWVGSAPKPASVLNNIRSWQRFCPEWLIVEWNEVHLMNIDISYVREAYEAKKWAFVADFLRLYSLEKYGGLYLDSDVEILQPIDRFMNNSFFMGFENFKGRIKSGPHFIGATKHHPIISGILAEYPSIHFRGSDGSLNYTTLPTRFDSYFQKQFGVAHLSGNDTVELIPGSYLFPWWYFCTPRPHHPAFAVHKFEGSWVPNRNSTVSTEPHDVRHNNGTASQKHRNERLMVRLLLLVLYAYRKEQKFVRPAFVYLQYH